MALNVDDSWLSMWIMSDITVKGAVRVDISVRTIWVRMGVWGSGSCVRIVY